MTRYMISLSTPIALAALLLGGCVSSAEEDDVGRTTAAVCCGASCCNIGGMCFGSGDPNPANSCEMCDPSSSNNSFTAIPGCTGGGRDAGGGGTPPPSGGGDDGGCSVTAVGADASPLAALGLALVFAFGVARRRRRS